MLTHYDSTTVARLILLDGEPAVSIPWFFPLGKTKDVPIEILFHQGTVIKVTGNYGSAEISVPNFRELLDLIHGHTVAIHKKLGINALSRACIEGMAPIYSEKYPDLEGEDRKRNFFFRLDRLALRLARSELFPFSADILELFAGGAKETMIEEATKDVVRFLRRNYNIELIPEKGRT